MANPDHSYWQGRWQRGEIGFHEQGGNALLRDHLHRFRAGSRVLVPLCGKAEDMRVFQDAGHGVCGLELAPEACAGFFEEQRIPVAIEQRAPFRLYRGGGVDIFQGDLFNATPALVGTCDAAFDRAALVALNPMMRLKYVEVLRALLKPKARLLLVTLRYDQSLMQGPPWSIDDALVRSLFRRHFVVEPLETRTGGHTPRLKAAGIKDVTESLYLLTRM